MSILTGKHILVIGEETDQLSKLEAALITYGSEIATTTCEQALPEHIQAEHTGLILLNHLHDGVHCSHLLESLREAPETKSIPVVALVQGDRAHIAEVMLLGATDYFLEFEDVHTIVDKIKQALGDTHTIADSSVLDLTTPKDQDQAGTRVFAVEDDPLLQNLLATRFEKSGLTFEMASDGVNLISKIESFKPQIIILDLMLPGVDGFDLLRDIKATSAIAGVPVVIFSNKDSQDDRKRATELGAKGFYVKAMTDLSELLEIISSNKQS